MGKKNQLTEEEYGDEISQVRDKITVVSLNLNEKKTDISEVEVCLKYCQNFIRTAALVWFDAPPLWKIKYQAMIFPNGVKYAFDDISNRDLALPFRLNRQFEESKNDNVAGAGVYTSLFELRVAGNSPNKYPSLKLLYRFKKMFVHKSNT